MLVISPKAFNQRTGIVIGFPMTSSEGNADNPFAVAITTKGKTGYLLAHQPKSFDWRDRKARPFTKGQVTLGDPQSLAQALALLEAGWRERSGTTELLLWLDEPGTPLWPAHLEAALADPPVPARGTATTRWRFLLDSWEAPWIRPGNPSPPGPASRAAAGPSWS